MSRQDSTFELQLSQLPSSSFPYLQAIWSASVKTSVKDTVTRWLNADACSGIIFLFQGSVALNGKSLQKGINILSASQSAQRIELYPGAQLCGIRFQVEIENIISRQATEHSFAQQDLENLARNLALAPDHNERVHLLKSWLYELERPLANVPSWIWRAMADLGHPTKCQKPEWISARQLERQFKQHLGVSPKSFQRIKRTRRALEKIKQQSKDTSSSISLAQLSMDQGYSDQAHMTREFRRIAKITPDKYRQAHIKRRAL